MNNHNLNLLIAIKFFSFLLLSLTFNLPCKQHLVKIYENLYNPQEKTVDINTLPPAHPSLHFLLATIGRNTIFRMLDSLGAQLEPQDYLTIVFDARDDDNVLEKVKLTTSKYPCTVNIIFEEENLGFWGHGIRNKYQDLPGDFILHCDDDNFYTPDSISVIRKICTDKTKFYSFQVRPIASDMLNKIEITSSYKRRRRQIPITHDVKKILLPRDTDTGSGVIPAAYNKLTRWEYVYGGDKEFYKKLYDLIDPHKIVLVDFTHYYRIKTRPQNKHQQIKLSQCKRIKLKENQK